MSICKCLAATALDNAVHLCNYTVDGPTLADVLRVCMAQSMLSAVPPEDTVYCSIHYVLLSLASSPSPPSSMALWVSCCIWCAMASAAVPAVLHQRTCCGCSLPPCYPHLHHRTCPSLPTALWHCVLMAWRCCALHHGLPMLSLAPVYTAVLCTALLQGLTA